MRAPRWWARLRSWRRIRFTHAGAVYTAGTLLVGLAAFNTGNNLLYLLWGAMLGSIVVSSWLSEQAIRNVGLTRRLPRGVFAGHPLRVRYELRNDKRRLPSYSVEVGEGSFFPAAFVPLIPAQETIQARLDAPPLSRGVYPLREVTVSTSFPFGLFVKSRDVTLPAELVVWPRNDRSVPHPAYLGGQNHTRAGDPPIRSMPVGDYRGLRPYRAGDDPRDIHWRTTARIGEPMVREYERIRGSEFTWICLDRRGDPSGLAEEAVEMAASLSTSCAREARRFGFYTQGTSVEPAAGAGQLEKTLEALARVTFSPNAPAPTPPGPPAQCVLITLEPRSAPLFVSALSPRRPDPIRNQEEGHRSKPTLPSRGAKR